MGCFNAFDVPSRQSFVVDLVEKKEDLGNAIALNSLMFNSARLIGPSVAGILLASAGEGICFLANAISYLFVIGSLLLMKVPKRVRISGRSLMMKEMKEGFSYAFGFPPIKHIIILLGIMGVMTMPYAVLMPVFAKEVLGGGSYTFGFLMGAAGFGAFMGGIYLASKTTILRLGKIVPISAALTGFGLIFLSMSKYFPVAMFMLTIAGLGMMLHTASSNTILQTIVEEDKRGRLMSIYSMAIMGTSPFGSLMAGGLAKILGVPGTIFAGGVVCIIGAVIFYIKLPDLEKLVRPVYVKLGVIPEIGTALQIADEQSLKRSE
jgi:MFS family permease